MARIEGVNLPNHKHIVIGLTSIYGIGRPSAIKICDRATVAYQTKVKDLTDEQLERLRLAIKACQSSSVDRDPTMPMLLIEGDLRRFVSTNIKRLMDIGSYRGMRHRKGLPVHGQRTRTNARTRKGPRRAAASLKK